MPLSSVVTAELRTLLGACVTSAGTTPTSTRAVAVPPRPLPTWYSIGGSLPTAVAGTVT